MIVVWYQLYIGEIKTGQRDYIEIEDGRIHIGNLKRKIIEKRPITLHCNAADLFVFQSNKEGSYHDSSPLEPETLISSLTSDDLLYVVAVAPLQIPPAAAAAAAVPPVAAQSNVSVQVNEMASFFSLDIKGMDLVALGSNTEPRNYWINTKVLSWTSRPVAGVYWRECYSYILCSLVGALDKAYDEFTENPTQNPTKSFVLTGVQGTGKSVLGCFIALILGKLKWNVTYKYGQNSYRFGDIKSLKQLLLVDASDGTIPTFVGTPGAFNVFVTSCNGERWHSMSSQEVWTIGEGNYIFIDTNSPEELVDMACQSISTEKEANEHISAAFTIVGGVARFCAKKTISYQSMKQKVQSAVNKFSVDLPGTLRRLEDFDDSPQPDASKQYPGLVGHFQPTNVFRNRYRIGISSDYCKQLLAEKIGQKNDSDISQLLNELLGTSIARGFAGCIWEPLFNRKILQSVGSVRMIGCELPTKNHSMMDLLPCTKADDIDSFEFTNLEDFTTKCRTKITGSSIIIGKAKSRIQETIDGILVKTENGESTFVGLQLTVAESKHTLRQKGLEALLDAARNTVGSEKIKTTAIQIWFLEPEESLNHNLSFSHRQAVVFSEETKSSNKRKRTTSVQQSNNPDLWPPHLKKIQQYIAVATFRANNEPTKENTLVLKFCDAVNKTEKIDKTNDIDQSEPSLRTWESTIQALPLLKDILHSSLYNLIESDLEAEGETIGKFIVVDSLN